MASRVRKGFPVSAACVLGISLGCCKDMPIVATIDGGGTIDGGPDAGVDGGPYLGDAGGCRVRDGGLVPAGTWLDPTLGSCVLCDPTLNPDGWTALDGGQICEGLTSMQTFGPLTVPYSGLLVGGGTRHLSCLAGTARVADVLRLAMANLVKCKERVRWWFLQRCGLVRD